MTKDDALAIFGGVRGLADALGITEQAISQWGETVPRLRELQIRQLSDGKDALDILRVLEDAANHAYEQHDKFPAHCSGGFHLELSSQGVIVSLRLLDRRDEVPHADHRLISYHAIESSKNNILIDAMDMMLPKVLARMEN